MKLIGQCFYQYTNSTDISADVANFCTNINASVILVSVIDFTDVPMLKIWPILAATNINTDASLLCSYIRTSCTCAYICNCFRLDENLTVKVADFGLSRDVYVTDYYLVSHSNPLPVKWLAPESLFDKVFSEKTDVVSVSDLFTCT